MSGCRSSRSGIITGMVTIALVVMLAACGQVSKTDPMSEALVEAAAKGNIREVERLIGAGVDLDTRDRTGRTPLMAATQKGHLDLVKLLLDKGAQINAKDKSGETALSLARQRGPKELRDLLREYGAKE